MRWLLAVLLTLVVVWQLALAQPPTPPRPPIDPALDLLLTRVMTLENRVSMLTARVDTIDKAKK